MINETYGGSIRKVVFTPLYEDSPSLSYATAYSSGIDLRCADHETICLAPGEFAVIGTGYSCKLRKDCEGQIRSKSGLAAKYGIAVLNSPGTIDADYDGPILVILINHGRKPFYVKYGDKIAQFVVCPVFREMTYMEAIPKERGEGGFGSTGE